MRLQQRTDGGPGIEVVAFDAFTATEGEIHMIRDAIYEAQVVVLRDQPRVIPHEYLDFGRQLGRGQTYPIKEYHHPAHPEIYVSSNRKLPNGNRFGVARAGGYWHTDASFLTAPWALTMLHMPVLPETRRETHFVNMAQVYEDLGGELRSLLGGLHALHGHNGRFQVRDVDVGGPVCEVLEELALLSPDARHPCILLHPVSGKRVLYVNEGFTSAIDGLASSSGAVGLLQGLFAESRRPERIQVHVWRRGDIVIWDNRSVIHRSGGVSDVSEYVALGLSMTDNYPFFGNKSHDRETIQ